ncbi:hypothetical protein K1X76_06605 [bacterium]|nr:hypothetical protein [bacterium]
MKKYFLMVIVLALPALAFAQTGRFQNKVRLDRELEKIDAVVDNIPIFRERLPIQHTLLGPLHAEDAFTKSKDAILRSLRVDAYKVNANAISEFKCKKIAKSILQACQGFAVHVDENTLKAYLDETSGQ